MNSVQYYMFKIGQQNEQERGQKWVNTPSYSFVRMVFPFSENKHIKDALRVFKTKLIRFGKIMEFCDLLVNLKRSESFKGFRLGMSVIGTVILTIRKKNGP